jgi:hypothetical protein
MHVHSQKNVLLFLYCIYSRFHGHLVSLFCKNYTVIMCHSSAKIKIKLCISESLNLNCWFTITCVLLKQSIYIYSLYIKSPELPIIEEAQASQYGHFG